MEHQIALLLHTQECMSHFPLAMADANKMAAVYIHEACVTCDPDLMRGYMELQEEFLALSIHNVVTKTPRESNLLNQKEGRQLPRNQFPYN